MLYRLNKNQEIVPTILTKIIQGHLSTEVPRLQTLENYYKGATAITTRVMADATKPNNKVVSPYARYITDTLTGFFMGKPVSYSASSDEDIDLVLAALKDNSEQDENATLATDASIYGVAYELVYLNELGQPRFKSLDAKEVILIIDDTLEEELLYGIRYYLVQDIVADRTDGYVEVYSRETITTYKGTDQFGDLQMIAEPFAHYFNQVPIVEYKNNDYYKGDFEDVITLIDAYDKVLSDSVNDFEAFTNAYLVLKGVTADAEDLANMREQRTLLLDTDSDVSWLIKDAPEAQNQNLLKNTEDNIHKFSHCPDMNDESFASNASGVAMRYKTMGTEDIALIKERKFKRGLQYRLELLTNILGLKGSMIDWKDIDIKFSRNLPVSLSEDMDAILSLTGIVSRKTQLAQVPFIDDVDAELAQVQLELEALPNFYTEAFPKGE